MWNVSGKNIRWCSELCQLHSLCRMLLQFISNLCQSLVKVVLVVLQATQSHSLWLTLWLTCRKTGTVKKFEFETIFKENTLATNEGENVLIFTNLCRNKIGVTNRKGANPTHTVRIYVHHTCRCASDKMALKRLWKEHRTIKAWRDQLYHPVP